jgi:ubiquinone/menaquinone biosynthesis C-methylase UbiE
MDMHAMEFGDSRFDAVYASHSLEHAYDVGRVVTEIARVARPGAVVGVEVPLGPGSSDADRVESGSVEDLRTAMASIARDELWADEQPAGSATNTQGTPVARLVRL